MAVFLSLRESSRLRQQAPQAFAHWRCRGQLVMRLQALVISPRMANITGTRSPVIDRRQAAAQPTDLRQQLIQADRLAPAHIHRTIHHLRRSQRLGQQRQQVLDIEEVAGLLAITEHTDWQPLLDALGKDADHPGVRRGWILPRAKDIEETKDRRLQTMLAAIEIQVDRKS